MHNSHNTERNKNAQYYDRIFCIIMSYKLIQDVSIRHGGHHQGIISE
jgi:hypothetical protein